jgi:signal transduction histidine kinase
MTARLPRIPLPRLTIRKMVELWAGSAFLVWAILVIGWLAARTQLSRLGEQALHDVQTLDMARELELAILSERREDLLWHATGETPHRERRKKLETMANQIAARLGAYIPTTQGREALSQIRNRLKTLDEHPTSPAPPSLDMVVQSADDLLDSLNQFYLQNEEQTKKSMRAARHMYTIISYWALSLSAGTAILLFLGSISIIHHVVNPALAISNAATAFGRGDFSARAPVLHEDELGATARTFNNMAEDIANREKDRLQFVAMVVHDLKNPALAIEMAARLLGESVSKEEKFGSYLDAMTREAQRLRTIVRDLTDDIQVASGHFSVEKAPVDLCALVRQWVQAQAAAFSDHEVVVEVKEPCTILGDARRIERVVMNLVSNAVKYSPPGTRITLRTEKRGSFALLSVSDQGPGIRKEDLQVIFQPFGRGRSADTFAEGTGMGLYVVKQIVEAHDGRIEVESELGHGATFRVWLPLVQADERD